MILWEHIGYSAIGIVGCILVQSTLIIFLLAQRRRHRRAEQALRASETMYRRLAENASDMISRHAADGRIVYVSPACQRLLGYQPAEMIGHVIDPFIQPDDLQMTWDAIGAAVTAGHDGYSIQHRIRHKQGHWVWAETKGRFLRDNQGNLAEIQCLVRDITDRKHIEEELRFQKALLESQSEAAPDGILVVSPEDRILSYNQRFVEMWGIPPEVIESQSDETVLQFVCNQLITPNDFLARVRDPYAHPDKQSQDEIVRKDGRSIERYSTLIKGNEGMVYGRVWFFHDITDRQQAEQALRASEEKFSTLFRVLPAGISVSSFQEGRFLEVNEAFLRTIGYTRAEFIGKTSTELNLWTNPAGRKQFVEPLQQHGAVREIELELRTKSGAVLTALFSAEVIEIGQQPCLISAFMDITDLKQAEQDLRRHQEDLEDLVAERTIELRHEIAVRKQTEQFLRESETKYRLFAENATDVIWTMNNARQFTYISPSIEQLLGYTPEEIMQKTIEQTMTPAYLKRRAELRAQKREDDPDPARIEVEHLCKDGSIVWAEIIVKRLYDDQGQHIGLLGISRDIRDRKRTEDELKHAKEAAEAANRAKSMFLSNMSHELRTPLNAILGFAQLLARETTLSPVQQEYVGTINHSGEHLLKLINNVLNLSKIEAGHMAVNRKRFDLWQTLTTVEEMMRVRAEQKGLRFRVERMPDVPHDIISDENKLNQVLINVVGNAIKFTEKGAVTLTIENCRLVDDWKEDQPQRQASIVDLQFSIADTGPGIAPDELPLIFETFYQTSRPSGNEGTGLGLTISRKFVQLLGGELQVQSAVGHGAVFTFTIPVELAAHEKLCPSPASREVFSLAPCQSPVRILVAEDQAENRQFLRNLLTSVGFDVQVVTNGQEAVIQAGQWLPHLILMDMRMPVMDGYEATQAIRELENTTSLANQRSLSDVKRLSHIPIIAITASVFEDDQQRILAVGCNALLRKPISIPELFVMIQTYLDVQYVYTKDGMLRHSDKPVPVRQDTLTHAALIQLPRSLLDRLAQAVLQININATEQAIAAIREYNSPLADTLTALAKEFHYQEIWKHIPRPVEGDLV